MASSQSSGFISTGLTDCPRCHTLCLGPCILPCGHVVCRKCLRDALQALGPRAVCACGDQLDLSVYQDLTVGQFFKKMGTDPVLEQLVFQDLGNYTLARCLNCENQQAARICLDCQDKFCDICSMLHTKGHIGEDHELKLLPNSFRNDLVNRGPQSRPRPALKSDDRNISNESGSQSDTIRNPGERSRPSSIRKSRDMSSSGTVFFRGENARSDVIRNTGEWSGSERARNQEESDTINNPGDVFRPDSILDHEDLPRPCSNLNNGGIPRLNSSRNQRRVSTSDSIDNPEHFPKSRDPVFPDSSSEDSDWKDWVMKETALLKQADQDQTEVKDELESLVALGGELLSRVDSEQLAVRTYRKLLGRLGVTQRQDGDTYVVKCGEGEGTMEVKTTSLEQRLRVVRACGHSPDLNTVHSLRTRVARLLRPTDPCEEEPEAVSRTPAAAKIDVTRARAERVFTISPSTEEDVMKPWVTSIACLQDGRLVMTDCPNKKVKLVEVPRAGPQRFRPGGQQAPFAASQTARGSQLVSQPATVSQLRSQAATESQLASHAVSNLVTASCALDDIPNRVTVLPDGLLAITTFKPVIYLLVASRSLSVTSRIQTSKRYWGVAGHSDPILIVSCETAVEVISFTGDLLRTIIDSSSLPNLKSPFYMCVESDRYVLVSDWASHQVYKLTLSSGKVADIYQNQDVRNPSQVCVDSEGNMYVGSANGRCVVARGGDGQWTQLLLPDSHSDAGYECPVGLCVGGPGRVVVAWNNPLTEDCLVIGYDLEPI